VLGAVVEDRLRQHRPDAGNGLQLLGARGVDVYRHALGCDLLPRGPLGLHRLDELLEVRGIGSAKLDAMRDEITTGGDAP